MISALPTILLVDYFEAVSPFMAVFVVALVVTWLLTPLVRRLAHRHGVVDMPGERKLHRKPIAYLGGVALFVGWLAGVSVAVLTSPGEAGDVLAGVTSVDFPLTVAFGAAVVTLVGLIDDVYHISPRVKIGGQLFAAAALAYDSQLGERLAGDVFAAMGLSLPPVVLMLAGTVVFGAFIVGGCNAMNLIDGLDGLAAGVSAIAMLGFLFIALFAAVDYLPTLPPEVVSAEDRAASVVRIVICLATLGAVLGFLPFNFNPAAIFMGDAGSLLLGYLAMATILQFASVPGKGPLMVMAGLIIFALPIADASVAVIRRLLEGRSIASADRKHLHHRLLESGLTVRRAVLSLYVAAVCLGLLGASLVMLRWRYVAAVFLVVFSAIFVAAYKVARRIGEAEQQHPA